MRLGALVCLLGLVVMSWTGDAAQPRVRATRAAEEVLRPALYFGEAERWRPLDADRFLAERFPDGGHRLCLKALAVGCETVSLRGASSLDPDNTWLDVHGSGSAGRDVTAPPAARASCLPRADCGAAPRSAIYVHTADHTLGRGTGATYRFYDYWFFYRFNDARPVPRLRTDAFDHEGDWEGATVVTNADDTVQWLQVAAHENTWTYLPRIVQWTRGHPRLYVATGTHASYVRSCRRTNCRQGTPVGPGGLLELPEGRFDGRVPWRLNDDRACAAAHCVRSLDEGRGAVLAAWPGHWGSTLRNNLRRSLKLVERILNGSIGAIRGGTFGAVVITGGAVSIKPLIDRSPCSPGFHGRFQPVQVPPSAGPEACKAGRPFSPTACRTWNGPFVAASVCNAYDLRTALLTGSFRTPPTFAVKTITRGSVDGIDQASGLVQVAGLPLVPRDRVQVFGPAASGTTLTVRAQTRLRVREVVFSELQLEGSPGAIATVEVTRRGGFVLHPGPAVVGGGPRASGGRPGVSGVSSSRVAVSGLRATRTGGTVQIRFVSSTTRALVALTRRPRQGVVAAATPRVKQGQVTVITLKARPSARYVAVAAIGSSGAVGRSRSVAIAPH